MKALASFSLALIAAILMAWFIMDQIRPALVSALKEERYRLAAARCHEAAAGAGMADEIESDIDRLTALRLRKSVNVALLDCARMEEMRLELISHGVSAQELDLIEVRALDEADVPAAYVADVSKAGE